MDAQRLERLVVLYLEEEGLALFSRELRAVQGRQIALREQCRHGDGVDALHAKRVQITWLHVVDDIPGDDAPGLVALLEGQGGKAPPQIVVSVPADKERVGSFGMGGLSMQQIAQALEPVGGEVSQVQ